MDAELWKERLSMTKNKNEIVGKSAGHGLQKAISKSLRETAEAIDHLDDRVTNLEDTMRINGTQEYKIHSAGQKSVMEALGGKESKAYKQISKKAFSALWRSFKHYFSIPRYGELPAKQYKEGLDFASTWQPDQEMKMLIAKINRG